MYIQLSEKYQCLSRKGLTVKDHLLTVATTIEKEFKTIEVDRLVTLLTLDKGTLPRHKRDLTLLKGLYIEIMQYFYSTKMLKAANKIPKQF